MSLPGVSRHLRISTVCWRTAMRASSSSRAWSSATTGAAIVVGQEEGVGGLSGIVCSAIGTERKGGRHRRCAVRLGSVEARREREIGEGCRWKPGGDRGCAAVVDESRGERPTWNLQVVELFGYRVEWSSERCLAGERQWGGDERRKAVYCLRVDSKARKAAEVTGRTNGGWF